jgi:hypothetical protein
VKSAEVRDAVRLLEDHEELEISDHPTAIATRLVALGVERTRNGRCGRRWTPRSSRGISGFRETGEKLGSGLRAAPLDLGEELFELDRDWAERGGIILPDLLKRLRTWRVDRLRKKNLPVSMLFSV